AASSLVVVAFCGSLAAGPTNMLRGLLANAHRVSFERGGLMNLTEKLEVEVIAIMALPLLLLVLAAIGGNIIQHPLVWSTEPLIPKLSKISPMAGAKRLFSKQALANFVKGLAKLGLIGALMVWVLWPERHRFDAVVMTDVAALMALTQTLSIKLLGAVVGALAIIAALDYLFQYRTWFQRQKMSLREMKEEFKHSEGDPTVKARIRQIRVERSRKRMMAAVPKASVVITNPTHYAVALQYDRGMNAP